MTILKTGWGSTIGIGVDDSDAHVPNGYYRIALTISDDCDEQEITRVHAGSGYTDLRSIGAFTSVRLTLDEARQLADDIAAVLKRVPVAEAQDRDYRSLFKLANEAKRDHLRAYRRRWQGEDT